MNQQQIDLLTEAKKATELSYSPYSKFRVGAAVLSEDGCIYLGANIENASSNLGICAERVAISKARMSGKQKITGIAIYCIDAKKDSSGKYVVDQALPCGGCLQWIAELAPEAWIISSSNNTPLYLADLLPRPFKL